MRVRNRFGPLAWFVKPLRRPVPSVRSWTVVSTWNYARSLFVPTPSVTPELDEFRSLLHELARESSALIRPLFGRPDLPVDLKEDHSPVTSADRGAEELMREMIRQRFPSHGVLGEEFGPDRTDAEFVWVLDPIDGTKSFITGVALWVTLIALLYRGEPVLGCIHQPILGQLMVGDGATTTLNGKAVHCRATEDLSSCTLLTCDWLSPARYQDGAAFERLCRTVRLARTWADGYGYLLLASGFADIVVDPIMNPWDVAALVPVVRGAGGIITDWHGSPPYPANSTVAACSPKLHAAVLRMLRA
ncbi:MAG: histidinol-phosphatase [Polyangiaceae bacterium]|nr:histidinol-phosphatase [Polyangiaceae bacterium]